MPADPTADRLARPLADFLDQADDQHAAQPAAIAAAMLARAPGLPADADGARALRLAGHVALAHLADTTPLAALLAALPPSLAQAGATAGTVQRLQWALAGAARDAARDALMLQAATIARQAWGHAGNWRHAERAEHRLALCHAAAGHGAAAVQHAQQCLAGCAAAGDAADAVEHFFAHEALAHAHRAAGDAGAAAVARATMAMLLPRIDEADGLRAWCADVLAGTPG